MSQWGIEPRIYLELNVSANNYKPDVMKPSKPAYTLTESLASNIFPTIKITFSPMGACFVSHIYFKYKTRPQ